ncbi:transcription factor containing NAC and TS-N domains [Moesziomyces antarcticus T-34]|uniref:Transcription factor containing NAC and TS-N domains n=1 Tax=Pseudozyma antarctica (strain T-34) TaxID=1151754 RepID=M9MG56_PSEA3|nr:transcription factor containing NAC and TS-N domains [Moesziomyces antarcticus T-34]
MDVSRSSLQCEMVKIKAYARNTAVKVTTLVSGTLPGTPHVEPLGASSAGNCYRTFASSLVLSSHPPLPCDPLLPPPASRPAILTLGDGTLLDLVFFSNRSPRSPASASHVPAVSLEAERKSIAPTMRTLS